MQVRVIGAAVSNGRKGRLFAGGALAALAVAMATPASALTLTAGDATQLQDAINQAVASGQASTITLTASFATSTPNLPPTVPITIDTNGFTLTGNLAGTGTATLVSSGAGQTLTLKGVITGADDPAGLSGNTGLRAINGTSIVNDGVIKGGVGTFTTASNTGAILLGGLAGGTLLTNNGTISGGDAGSSTGAGLGIQITGTSTAASTLINTETGVVQGGSGAGKIGGSAVLIGSPSTMAALDNRGVIRGGSDPTDVAVGGVGVDVNGPRVSITNSGTIEGGNRNVAIQMPSTAANMLLVNSGTIRAGAGQGVAIRMPGSGAGSGILELHAGSRIEGAVTANAGGTNDILRLGGTGADVFDVSTVGPQYQSFDIFQKTGTGTWILIGAGATPTPWSIQQGTLQIGGGGTTGSIIGNVTNDGVLAFHRSDVSTFANVVSGSGLVEQRGTGTTILSGVNTYTGGTAINAGTLQISQDANLGDAGGGISFNGGVLQNTFAFATNRLVALNGPGGTFQTDADFQLNGVVSGSGGLTKTGAGRLIPIADNTYQGGTAINGGVVQVFADSNLGDAAGGLSFDGGTLRNTLAFSTGRAVTLNPGGGTLQADFDLTLSGAIGGSGGLTKTGAGVLTLTGENTYAGVTTVSAGVLQVGNGGATGSITGDLVNNSLVVLNRSTDTTYAGAISGVGLLTKTGAGKLNLTGVSTFGANSSVVVSADVQAGVLEVAAGGRTTIQGRTSVSNGGLVVTGPGSVFNSTMQTSIGNSAVGSLSLLNGGAYQTGALLLSNSATGDARVTVNGQGSLLSSGSFQMTNGVTTVNISGGGRLQSGAVIFGGTSVSAAQGTGSVTITGQGSRWDGAGIYLLHRGVLSVLDGGVVTTGGTMTVGPPGGPVGNVTGARADVIVSGAGSQLLIGGLLVMASGTVDIARTGTLTIADGGFVSVGGGSNNVNIATQASHVGTINIGGATAGAGTAGTLQAALINFGPGVGSVNFNQTDATTFATPITGGGVVNQNGPGTTVLTGSNSYTGATTINAGTLRINGDQTAATALTSVNSGGALGGSGIVGGDVVVANGGALAPGNSPGTLTINGGLTLNAGSISNFEFGQPNVAGGPLNDLIDVKGALTLDGVLNVSVAPGGAFDPGLYRVFNYASMINNGLDLGVLPPGADVYVRTSVPGQVDLVNTTGLALDFWDGAAGTPFDGTITGGDGVWQAITGNTNWTEATGDLNAPYHDASFAVFSGAAGRVQVDNSLGTVSAAGLQFTTDGYAIEGGAVTLAGQQAVVRVGDGTSAGAGMTATIDAPLVGGARLVKADLGTLVLTAANTYGGGTTISGGVLRVGNGGTSGSITGDVVDNGELVFDRSDDITYAGAISGSGVLNKDGAGTLTLTGANSYSGGTVITAGVLKGAAVNLGASRIQNDGGLVVEQATEASFAAPVDGAGSLIKTGAGKLTYTGTGNLSGTTTVAAGTLAVNGSLAQSTVDVLNGATLMGGGTIGGATVRSGAIAAPGNSIGTLHVNGAYAQAAGSTYQVEIDPASSDLIQATGSASLAPGAVLNVVKTGQGLYQPTTVYRVLSAAGGLTGTYNLSGDLQLTAFLGLDDSYDGNNAYLSVIRTGDPGDVATTPNQGGVAGGLPGTPVETPVLNSPTADAARNLLDQLSGDGHAGAKGVLVNDSRLVRDLAVDRLRDILCAEGAAGRTTDEGACPNDPDRAALWGQAFGAWGSTRGQPGVGNVSRSTGGFLIGLDLPMAKFGRLGWFAGYSRTELGLHARTGNADVDAYHLGVYGGGQKGQVGVRFGAAYSWQDIGTTRQVVLPGVSNYLRAQYDAGAAQAFVEAGYRLEFGRLAVEPFLNAAYVSLKTSAFNEWGGIAALSARSDELHNSFTTLGARPSANLAIGSAKATFRGLIGWRHAFGAVAPTQTVAFAGGPDFVIQGAAIARDAGVLELGADVRVGASGTFGLTYGGQYSDRVVDQSVRGQLTFRF